MFQFPWSSFIYLWIEYMILEGFSSGFPHSEIPGSKSVCDYPRLIGAYPVLHRLLVPRHSPYALISLTRYIIYCNYISIILINYCFISYQIHSGKCIWLCGFQCSVKTKILRLRSEWHIKVHKSGFFAISQNSLLCLKLYAFVLWCILNSSIFKLTICLN